ncbi:lachesin-like isoform X1 [Cherax quadricarinatus]
MCVTSSLRRFHLLWILRLTVCFEYDDERSETQKEDSLKVYHNQPHFLHDLTTNVSIQLGSTAHLHCRIRGLRDQSVSWYRRRGDEIHLITFGFHTYHNDDRFTMTYEHPHDWRLRIRYVQHRDEGTYQCQVSTHPPLIHTIHLHVVEAAVQILDGRGMVLQEKFYRTGSTIELQCRVSGVPTATALQIAWYHDNNKLNYNTSRGGVSVKTELRGSIARSWLRVANAQREDSGTYYCNVTQLSAARALIHVVTEEYPAAIQRGTSVIPWSGLALLSCFTSILAQLFLNSCSSCYKYSCYRYYCSSCYCCAPHR